MRNYDHESFSGKMRNLDTYLWIFIVLQLTKNITDKSILRSIFKQ